MITDTQSPTKIATKFARTVGGLLKSKSTVCVSASTFGVFNKLSGGSVLHVTSPDAVPTGQLFDVIWGDLPLGVRPAIVESALTEKKLKVPGNWILVLDLLGFLSKNGTGFFLVEPHGFGTTQGRQFQALMSKAGYFINAFFDAPKNLLSPRTALTPTMVAISRAENEKQFVGELATIEQADQVATNFAESKDTGTVEYGTFIERDIFVGFDQLRALIQIDRLETQYNQFEKHLLKEVADEINAVGSGGEHKDMPNSIYIPKIGNSKVVANLEETTIKHQNYYQVVLNTRAVNDYVAAFFQSEIGQLVLRSLTTSSVIPHTNKRDIENALITLPELSQQCEIADTHKQLSKLKQAIEQFDQDISLNPTGTKHIRQQLDSMLKSINILSEPDRMKGVVREGESKTREFKETFSLDIRKGSKAKYIETACLKTIVAFLNSDGGTLLVGVADNGSIPGVNLEIKKFHKNNVDNFFKHIKNLLKTRIGEEFYPYFDHRMVDIDESRVLEFDCRPSDDPCYLDGEVFYVRTNPATDKLEGPKLVEYVRHHFVS